MVKSIDFSKNSKNLIYSQLKYNDNASHKLIFRKNLEITHRGRQLMELIVIKRSLIRVYSSMMGKSKCHRKIITYISINQKKKPYKIIRKVNNISRLNYRKHYLKNLSQRGLCKRR